MDIERNTVIFGIAAAAMTLLQIILAPNIALFSAQPNIMLAFVLVVAVMRNEQAGYVLPFVLGLLFDLLGSGPVGAMSFLFLFASFLVSKACAVLENGSILVRLMMFVAGALFVEVVYGGILLALGMGASPLDMLVFRALPCALYDTLAAYLVQLALRSVLREPSRGSALDTVRLR